MNEVMSIKFDVKVFFSCSLNLLPEMFRDIPEKVNLIKPLSIVILKLNLKKNY